MKPLYLVPELAPEKPKGPTDADRASLLAHASTVWAQTLATLQALQKGERNPGLYRCVARLAGYTVAPWSAWTAEDIRSACFEVFKAWDVRPGVNGAPSAGHYDLCIETMGRALQCTEPAELPIGIGLFDDLKREADRRVAEKRPALCNFEIDPIDGKSKRARGLPEIAAEVREKTGDWPRLCNSSLFTPGHDRLHYLTKESAFSAWLQSQFDLRWVGTVNGLRAASLAELREALASTAYRYEGTSELPHEPLIPDWHYSGPPVFPGAGGALRDYLALFNPDTEADRDLLLAAMLTLCWGGSPGQRPAFIITSRHGKGVGKTATAFALAQPWGGFISMRQKESSRDLTDRLLTDGADQYRCVYIDNAKGHIDSGDIEGMITAPAINGRKMFTGEARRPNYITWLLSANDASLSSDLASRAVVIEIGPKQHERDFYSEVRAFLTERGAELIADCVGALRGPRYDVGPAGRFGAWQREVLAVLPRAAELSAIVSQRSGDVDDDAAEGAEVAAAIRMYLTLKQKPASWEGTLSSGELMIALAGIWPDLRSTRGMWARLGSLLGSGELARSGRLTGGRLGRGLYWRP